MVARSLALQDGFITLRTSQKHIQCLNNLKRWLSYILTPPLRSIQTNWGEFRPLTKSWIDLGVHHRLICPHTQHQNGVIEGLPTTSLKFSFSIQSCSISLWTTKFSKLLGPHAFPYLDPTTHKFDFRSQECLFLGYSTVHKGYNCLFPQGNRCYFQWESFSQSSYLSLIHPNHSDSHHNSTHNIYTNNQPTLCYFSIPNQYHHYYFLSPT